MVGSDDPSRRAPIADEDGPAGALRTDSESSPQVRSRAPSREGLFRTRMRPGCP